MKLNFCKILLLIVVQFSLAYCHPKEIKVKTTEKQKEISDSIFHSIVEIEQIYKAKGYDLLKVKTHTQGKIDNTLLIFDNNKIDTLDQGSICKRVLVICKNEKNNIFKIIGSNKSVIGCRNNYCSYDESFLDIETEKDHFIVMNQYCVGEGRRVEYIEFKYENGDYFLSQYHNVVYHREDPDYQTTSKVLSPKDFGTITFKNFNKDKF